MAKDFPPGAAQVSMTKLPAFGAAAKAVSFAAASCTVNQPSRHARRPSRSPVPEMVKPRVRLHGYALIPQRGTEPLRGRFERVGLNGGRDRLIVRTEKGFRFLRAEQADHALDERTRVARLYGERFKLVRKGKRLSPSAVHIAQHRVHQSRRAG